MSFSFKHFFRLLLKVVLCLIPVLFLVAHFLFLPKNSSFETLQESVSFVEDFRLTYKDRVLYGVDTGAIEKSPVLFIHGSPGRWDGWEDYFKNEFLRNAFRLIAIDRPGFGFSDYGKTQRSLPEQVHQMAQVFSRIPEGQKVIVVGHSLGGPLAAKMAILYPEKVKGIVLVAGSADPAEEFTRWIQYPANWPLIRNIIPPAAKVSNQEIMSFKQYLEAMQLEWETIEVPVVIIHGTDDPLVPVENGDFMAGELTNSVWVDYQKLEGVNHFIVWEYPELIEEAIFKIDDFLP